MWLCLVFIAACRFFCCGTWILYLWWVSFRVCGVQSGRGSLGALHLLGHLFPDQDHTSVPWIASPPSPTPAKKATLFRMTSWNIVSIVTHHAHNFICPILWALPLIISFNTSFAIFQYLWDFQITFNILTQDPHSFDVFSSFFSCLNSMINNFFAYTLNFPVSLSFCWTSLENNRS